MDHPERYRAALAPFLIELREALARVAPDISETPLGATLLATILIERACSLMRRGQIGEAEARKIIEGLVCAHVSGGTSP